MTSHCRKKNMRMLKISMKKLTKDTKHHVITPSGAETTNPLTLFFSMVIEELPFWGMSLF